MRDLAARVDQRFIMICDLHAIMMVDGNFSYPVFFSVASRRLDINNGIHRTSKIQLVLSGSDTSGVVDAQRLNGRKIFVEVGWAVDLPFADCLEFDRYKVVCKLEFDFVLRNEQAGNVQNISVDEFDLRMIFFEPASVVDGRNVFENVPDVALRNGSRPCSFLDVNKIVAATELDRNVFVVVIIRPQPGERRIHVQSEDEHEYDTDQQNRAMML